MVYYDTSLTVMGRFVLIPISIIHKQYSLKSSLMVLTTNPINSKVHFIVVTQSSLTVSRVLLSYKSTFENSKVRLLSLKQTYANK